MSHANSEGASMSSGADAIVEDFKKVARLAGQSEAAEKVEVEDLGAPHRPPTRLPTGKMAVYVFWYNGEALKIGKVGAKSQARYTSQHYSARSAPSTLARSILEDSSFNRDGTLTENNIGEWIKGNLARTNFLMDAKYPLHVVSLLEVFLHCRLNPRFEGHKPSS